MQQKKQANSKPMGQKMVNELTQEEIHQIQFEMLQKRYNVQYCGGVKESIVFMLLVETFFGIMGKHPQNVAFINKLTNDWRVCETEENRMYEMCNHPDTGLDLPEGAL